MINPVWLRSFCTLVDVGHFTRTAETLHMTQSGVSQHIHKLEAYLGQPLLIRQGKQFTLTSTGQRLYQEGQGLLLSFSELEKRVTVDPAYEGLVRLASPGSVGLKLYAHLLNVQQRHPQLVIDYRFAPNSDIERLIAEHKVDIGLMTCLPTLRDITLQPIATEALLLVTPAPILHPDWDALMALGFIDHPDGAHHASQLLSVNYSEFQSTHQFKRTGFSNQINLVLTPVSLGLGFTVLPRYAVADFQDSETIRVHTLPHTVSETLSIGTHTHTYITHRMKTVMHEAEQCLQTLEESGSATVFE